MTWDLNPLPLLIKITGPPKEITNINKTLKKLQIFATTQKG
jgi:hypothetical protein